MSIEASNVDVSEQGSGPSVVFTHGWTDNRTSWTGVIDELAVDNHCVSWSLRAHGESEVTAPGSYSREHGLADMMAVTDRADAPYVLVGHSLGGYLS